MKNNCKHHDLVYYPGTQGRWCIKCQGCSLKFTRREVEQILGVRNLSFGIGSGSTIMAVYARGGSRWDNVELAKVLRS